MSSKAEWVSAIGTVAAAVIAGLVFLLQLTERTPPPAAQGPTKSPSVSSQTIPQEVPRERDTGGSTPQPQRPHQPQHPTQAVPEKSYSTYISPYNNGKDVESSSTRDTTSVFYSDILTVEANDSGKVFVRGHADLIKLVQFCPDEWADNCSPSIAILRDGDHFKLNKDGIRRHQTAFNFQDENDLWYQISKGFASPGSNVVIKKGKNSEYFEFTNTVTPDIRQQVQN